MQMKFAFGAHRAVLAPLTAVALAGPLAAQTAATDGFEMAQGVFESKAGSKFDVDRGRIAVPENRSKADSRSISLAFLRIRSPLEKPGAPVFLLAGGPGGSSIRMLESLAKGGGMGFLRALGGDAVAIDQRGVGASEPNLESTTSFDFDVEAPGDPQALLERMQKVCREEAARWRAKGVDLAGYTTVESADDIDALRRKLRYEKIVLWGGSYGSHLAMATIRRHEKHIARAVLIVPEGPDHTIKLPSYAQDGLERIAALVRADEKLKEHLPDMLGTLAEVLARLEKAPVFVEIGGRKIGVSKFDVQRQLAGAIGRTSSMRSVPAIIHAMSRGDFKQIAQRVMMGRYQSTVRSAMQMVMDSASGLSPARKKRIAEEAPRCLLGDAVNFPFPLLREAWGAPDLGESFRGPLKTEIPVLFIAGDLDSRTPVRNAKELMEHMPHAHLIVVENAGHDLRWTQREVAFAWRDFLAGKKVELVRAVAPKPKFFSIRGR